MKDDSTLEEEQRRQQKSWNYFKLAMAPLWLALIGVVALTLYKIGEANGWWLPVSLAAVVTWSAYWMYKATK